MFEKKALTHSRIENESKKKAPSRVILCVDDSKLIAIRRIRRRNVLNLTRSFPSHVVVTVPNAAYKMMAMNKFGYIPYRMKENDTRSMIDVTKVRNNCNENDVNVLTSSQILWSGLSIF